MAKDKNSQAPDSVDQIRNILFGEQIALIEKRFEAMEKSMNNSLNKLSEQLQSNNAETNKNLKSLQSQSSSDLDTFSNQHQKDIQTLDKSINNKITEVESDLLNQIQEGLSQLDHKASHRNDLATLLKNMADKLSD